MNKKSTRMAFGEALVELSDKYDFVVLDADLSKATCTNLFASKYSNRFFNMGISEADMMGNAAGMASCGAKVIAATFAIFATGRAYEQVRTSIAYADMDVKIIGTHAGVLIGEDGATHQCIEDIALMRAIPGMIILIAADANQVKPILEAAIKYIGPVYIRLGRLDVDYVYKKTPEALIGGADKLMDGTDVTIIATGEMVYESLEAAKILNAKNIKAEVINAYSIKPLNEDIIITSAKKNQSSFYSRRS